MRYTPLVAVLALAVSCSPGGDNSGSASGTREFADAAGWSLEYPAWMHVESSGAAVRVSLRETTFASFRPRRAVRSWAKRDSAGLRVDPPLTRSGVFPRDGVALRVLSLRGGPYRPPGGAAPELRLDAFPRAVGGVDPPGVPAVARRFDWDGAGYEVRVWIGPEAPEERRDAVEDLVTSLEFKPPGDD